MKLYNIFEDQISLSDRQKYVLAKITMAATPLLAYEAIVDSEPDVEASKVLHQHGFINVSVTEGNAALTSRGKQATVEYGIADESGQLTDVGTNLVNNYGDRSEESGESGESGEVVT